MKVVAAELEELRKAHQASEKRNMGEFIPQIEGTMENSVTKATKEVRSEHFQIHINENSPFSGDIQTDPILKNSTLR